MSSVLFFFFSCINFQFFSVFVSFLFTGVQKINPEENCPPPVRVRDWVAVRVRVGGQFSSREIVLEPFLPVENK